MFKKENGNCSFIKKSNDNKSIFTIGIEDKHIKVYKISSDSLSEYKSASFALEKNVLFYSIVNCKFDSDNRLHILTKVIYIKDNKKVSENVLLTLSEELKILSSYSILNDLGEYTAFDIKFENTTMYIIGETEDNKIFLAKLFDKQAKIKIVKNVFNVTLESLEITDDFILVVGYIKNEEHSEAKLFIFDKELDNIEEKNIYGLNFDS